MWGGITCMMTFAPRNRAEWAKFILFPFKVFVCIGWFASDVGIPVILGYALSLVVLSIGGVIQRVCGRRAESLVTFFAAIWAGIILWKLLPMLAR